MPDDLDRKGPAFLSCVLIFRLRAPCQAQLVRRLNITESIQSNTSLLCRFHGNAGESCGIVRQTQPQKLQRAATATPSTAFVDNPGTRSLRTSITREAFPDSTSLFRHPPLKREQNRWCPVDCFVVKARNNRLSLCDVS